MKKFIEHIFKLLGENKLSDALEKLQTVFRNSPQFYELINQSGRYSDLAEKTRSGLFNFTDSMIETTKIRYAIIDIVRELEESYYGNSEIKDQLDENLFKKKEMKNINQVHLGKGHNIGGDFISGDKIS